MRINPRLRIARAFYYFFVPLIRNKFIDPGSNNMKRKFAVFTFLFFMAMQTISAQTENKDVLPPDPADVASIDAIMKAVYDVISGDAGVKRDWDRFRTLFHKDARLIPTGKNPNTGEIAARVITPEQYVQNSGPFLEKNGFHETEIGRRTEIYGNIAHVFSAYAAKNKLSDKEPFMRGINSFQLFYDGKRWWVLTIYWQAETPENPLPKQYLKYKKQNK